MVTKTEGIKYIGSKRKLLGAILSSVDGLNIRSVLDLFTGSTRVAQAFKQQGLLVGCNDIASYSRVLGKTYIENNKLWPSLQPILDDLNGIKGKSGFLTKHYAGGSFSCGGKNPVMYWQRENTLKADAIRTKIDKLFTPWTLRWCVLITALIRALDAVDNTVGVQQAFLKKWCKRSYKELYLEMPFLLKGLRGEVYQQDAGELVEEVSHKYDLVYIDPPYTPHNYISYYHIWETLVCNDRPEVSGIVNRRKYPRSDYNYKKKALAAFSALLGKIQSPYILVSYNNEGLISPKEFSSVAKKAGRSIKRTDLNYQRNIMSQIGICNNEGTVVGNPGHSQNTEYLYLLY